MKYFAIVALIGASQAIRMRDDPICSSTGCDTLHYKDEGETEYPRDYVVPDYGADPEIAATQSNLSEAEKTIGQTYGVKSFKVPDGPPSNYVVPNFGIDNDIIGTAVSIKAAEVQEKHKWDWKLKPAGSFKLNKGVPPAQVEQVMAPKLDHDVIVTQSNIKNAESTLGPWDPLLVGKVEIEYSR